ncbi:hypothetical protein TRIUR3_35265 [Triticum urartu]|uniref:Endoplasmic reticulum-Golgi intermediate compartment protein 3 n=2 Tax=Triticinae TaxID=1648030 RepID=M7Z9S2_TRIUA|nr:hypothetical protein TRIUR3_35265 [Triticum urartu]
MELWSKLRSLDAYPKVNEDFYSRTLSGGLITIVSSLAILLLFFSEIRLYLYAATESKLTVDTSRGERLHINRHDIMKKRIDHLGNVIESRKDGVGSPKIERPLQNHGGRLDHNEVYCGSCYGSEESDDQCCNSCEEVRDSYRKKGWALTNVESIDQCKREGFVQRLKDEQGEGCNIHGFVDVNKVAGNFHFAPGKSLDHAFNFLQDMLNFQPENYNASRIISFYLQSNYCIEHKHGPLMADYPLSLKQISHKINKLSFGKEFPAEQLFFVSLWFTIFHVPDSLEYFSVEWKQEQTTGLTGMYQYFVKVVPTIYTDIRGRKIHSNQFSVTEHFREAIGLPRPPPGVYFFYEFSPIQVDFTEENTSLLHFLTNICAIVGGIFTVAGIIDSFVYHGHRAIKKKMEIGKLGPPPYENLTKYSTFAGIFGGGLRETCENRRECRVVRAQWACGFVAFPRRGGAITAEKDVSWAHAGPFHVADPLPIPNPNPNPTHGHRRQGKPPITSSSLPFSLSDEEDHQKKEREQKAGGDEWNKGGTRRRRGTSRRASGLIA